ncbi:MAG: hypothetical protein LZF86_20029 [Nitrospira sp.]|nr:MAG: hypothetical protein LZF86_20029 [Nitrospira sp.]
MRCYSVHGCRRSRLRTKPPTSTTTWAGLSQVIDGQGHVATYSYDAVGNLLSIARNTGSSTGVRSCNHTVPPRLRLLQPPVEMWAMILFCNDLVLQ